MKRKRLLDSYALLAYLNKENGFEKVRNVLANAQKSSLPVLMNELNVGETYYLKVKRNSSKTPASRITQGVYCCYGH